MSKPDIQSHDVKEYIVKPWKYYQAQTLPVTGILLAPSGGGQRCFVTEYDTWYVPWLFSKSYMYLVHQSMLIILSG